MTLSMLRQDYGSAGHSGVAVDASIQKLVKQEHELQRSRSYIQMLERALPFQEYPPPRRSLFFLAGFVAGAAAASTAMIWFVG